MCAERRRRSCRRHELRQADQVVGGGCEGKGPGDLFPTSVLHPSDSADRLHPAKALLDALADALADPIARVMRCAAIDGGAAGRVLRNVRRHVDLAQFPDEVRRIEALVATERDERSEPWSRTPV